MTPPASPPDGARRYGAMCRADARRILLVEEIDRVNHASSGSTPIQAGADLHQATRIPSHDRVRHRHPDLIEFWLEHLRRDLWFYEVVDAGAAATLIGATQRNERRALDRGEHLEWRSGHTLRVEQMAGCVVGQPHVERTGTPRTRGREQLAHVADLRRDSLRAFAPVRILAEQVTILLHRRAASGRIRDDVIRIGRLERRDVLSREVSGAFEISGVCVKRAATAGRWGTVYDVSIEAQRALGCAIGFAKQAVHDASAKQH